MNASIPLLSILSLWAPGLRAAPTPPTVHEDEPQAQGYEALVQEYEAAQADWKQRLRDSDLAGRRELRKLSPTAALWPRFEAGAQAGEGRALVWMATHLRDKGLSKEEREPELGRLYGELAAQHVAADWFGQVLDELASDGRSLDEVRLAAMYERTIETSPHAEVRAQAMVQLGRELLRSGDEAKLGAGERWLARASSELPDTHFGRIARSELEKPIVGRPAPDFQGATIDGHSFRLSDYRGKVVLLDFYGFW